MTTTKTLKLIVLFGLLCVSFARADIIHASTMIFTDNFNSDPVASGCPTGWDGGGYGSCSNASVVNTAACLEGNCMKVDGGGAYGIVRRVGTATSDGEISFYIYINSYPTDNSSFVNMGNYSAVRYFPLLYMDTSGNVRDLFGSLIFPTMPLHTWEKIDVLWTDAPPSPSYTHFKVEFNDDMTFHLINFSDYVGDLSSIAFGDQDGGEVLVDYMGSGSYMPMPYASVSSPTSGTTITVNSTILSGTYGNLDAGSYGYGYLHIGFKNPNNGLSSQVLTLPITSSAGSFSTPLSTFNITENGTWNIQIQQELDANTFVDLTPAGYHLIFNVAGNSTPYTFTDWNTWYTSNAAGGYSAPSDFANSIEGFFQPIFTNVYEFANQTLTYFNAGTAYDKGQQIGIVFPTTQAYLNKIDVFFGGFPLIPFFEFLIVVMLGIFIIRTIFKFIPFFG